MRNSKLYLLILLLMPALGMTEPAAVSPANGLESIWVSKNDGSVSCEKKSGVSLSEMAKELQTKGVKILNQQKIFDKKMRIAMCGTNKGTANGYQIPKTQKDAAIGAGFVEISAPQ